ncbi:MAG: hypothetical protein AB7F83_09375, partial [Lysobacterales bacterium]
MTERPRMDARAGAPHHGWFLAQVLSEASGCMTERPRMGEGQRFRHAMKRMSSCPERPAGMPGRTAAPGMVSSEGVERSKAARVSAGLEGEGQRFRHAMKRMSSCPERPAGMPGR